MHRRRMLNAMDETRLVVMLAFDDAQILDITGPLEVFARTSRYLVDNEYTGNPAYRVCVVAAAPGPVTTSSGMKLVAEQGFAEVTEADTVLVSGGIGIGNVLDPEVFDWLKAMAARVRRIGSICNGALVLARAGLLDGLSATTHWAFLEELRKCGHDIAVDNDALFTRHGNVYTSAGVTAGMDMALAMVEEDWGQPVSLAVAQQLVMFLKRPGGQSQFSSYLRAQAVESKRLQKLQLWLLDNLDEDLTVGALAARASMSPRTFARRFRETVGMTPGRYVEHARLEAARRKLEQSSLPVDTIAYRCGLKSAENLRRAFQRRLGVSPSAYRERFAGFGDS